MAAVGLVAVVALWLPFSPLATTLGFVAPPWSLLVIVFLIQILYVIGMETTKMLFYRHFAD